MLILCQSIRHPRNAEHPVPFVPKYIDSKQIEVFFMGKRIVIALGGNALGSNLPEQMIAVKQTAKAIVDLIEEGHEVIIAHGNGPQVEIGRAHV